MRFRYALALAIMALGLTSCQASLPAYSYTGNPFVPSNFQDIEKVTLTLPNETGHLWWVNSSNLDSKPDSADAYYDQVLNLVKSVANEGAFFFSIHSFMVTTGFGFTWDNGQNLAATPYELSEIKEEQDEFKKRGSYFLQLAGNAFKYDEIKYDRTLWVGFNNASDYQALEDVIAKMPSHAK